MPDPVPALPDSERRTTHTISGVGPYNVSFDLYGDGTDYQNWIKVYDDDTELTVTTDWTLDSPSGSLSTLSRPIDDARVTLVSGVRSGTLTIVGARRPRRATQLTEGVGESARSKNQTYTDIIATLREFWDTFSRTLRFLPGQTHAVLDKTDFVDVYIKGDSSGNFVPGGSTSDIEAGAVAAAASAAAAAASETAAAGSASSASSSASTASSAASTATTAAAAAAAAVGAVAFKYTWSTGTGGSPASGVVAVNNAAPASATALHINETDANGNAISAEQTRWGATVAAAGRSRIKIAKDAQNFLLLTITSARTDNGSDSTFTVTGGALTGSLSNGDTVYVNTDVSGADGAGTIGGSTGSTDNAYLRADGVGGATVQPARATEDDFGKQTVNYEDTSTNTVVHGLKISRTSSNAPASGIGTGIQFEVETAAGNNEVGATIEAVTTDVTSTSEDFDLVGKVMAAGAAAAEVFRFMSTGVAYLGGVAAAIILKANGGQTLTGGFKATPYAAGTKSSGTYTPLYSDGNFQTATNGGAHTLAPPADDCTIIIQYTNNGSAGAVTTSGFTKKTGDSITTANGDDFFFFITKVGSFSHLHVQALQ